MAIAKRLLGPDLAQRYGDVIGARPTGVGDIARDFALGALSGDPFKADQVKAKVFEQFAATKRQEEDQAFQRESAAREQLNGWFNLLDQVKKTPKDLRKDLLIGGAQKLGIDVTSPVLVKVITQYEKFGTAFEALTDPAVRAIVDEDPIAGIEQLQKMGVDSQEAIVAIQTIQSIKAQKATTQNVLAQAARAARGITPTPVDLAQHIRPVAEQELRLRRSGTASPDQPFAEMFRGKTDAEVQQVALAGGVPKPGKTSALDRILAEASGETPAAAAPAAPVVRRKAAGIPQLGTVTTTGGGGAGISQTTTPTSTPGLTVR